MNETNDEMKTLPCTLIKTHDAIFFFIYACRCSFKNGTKMKEIYKVLYSVEVAATHNAKRERERIAEKRQVDCDNTKKEWDNLDLLHFNIILLQLFSLLYTVC